MNDNILAANIPTAYYRFGNIKKLNLNKVVSSPRTMESDKIEKIKVKSKNSFGLNLSYQIQVILSKNEPNEDFLSLIKFE
jgi:hypothetical protein